MIQSLGWDQALSVLIEWGKNMYKVDLTKARAGQIAHFRCGGSAKIEEIINYSAGSMLKPTDSISFKFYGDDLFYNYVFENKDAAGLMSIIRFEDPPFDWKDVKNGMAFKSDYNKNVYIFIGYNSYKSYLFQNITMLGGVHDNQYESFANPAYVVLQRTPEHDIK